MDPRKIDKNRESWVVLEGALLIVLIRGSNGRIGRTTIDLANEALIEHGWWDEV